MNWFNIGAAVIIALLVVNSTVWLRRARSGARRSPGVRSRRLAGMDIALYLLMVASWVVGLALPVVSPESPSGRFMAHWWSMPSLFAWSVLCVIVVRVARAAVSMRAARRVLS